MRGDGRGRHHLISKTIIETHGRPANLADEQEVVVVRSCNFDWPETWLRPQRVADLDWSKIQKIAI